MNSTLGALLCMGEKMTPGQPWPTQPSPIQRHPIPHLLYFTLLTYYLTSLNLGVPLSANTADHDIHYGTSDECDNPECPVLPV
jgi:hypothetical protein